MATWGHSPRHHRVDGGGQGKLLQEQDTAYEYLCRLEEAKKWLESVVSCELPMASELEDALQNGVVLCQLGMKLLPDDPMWNRVYDLDQTKFKTKGLDYRYTDNINFWLTSLQKLGLPKVFYPVMTDIFHKKNMPKLFYCLHALSHLLKKKGLVPKAVDDLYGTAKFPHDALVQTTHTLKSRGRTMPAFGVVENLVEEELQYQAMGLCDSYEEELPLSPDEVIVKLSDRVETVFDDPKYMTSNQAKNHISVPTQTSVNGSEADDCTPFATVPCVSSEVTATLYLRKTVKKKSQADKSSLENSLDALNAILDQGNCQETLKALQQPDANFPFVYRDKEAVRYHEALIKEKKEGLPQSLLPVFAGVDREKCENLLEKMSPGAFLVRSSQTVKGAYVLSFKNQTGIKHWKLSTRSGKFYWGTSSLHSSIEEFVENFVQALSDVTKLYVYCGMTSVLQPTFQSTDSEEVINSLRETDDSLSYGQVCHVIKEVNTAIRRGRKSVTDPGATSNTSTETWNESMIVKLNRVEAETELETKGKAGSFLVRPSERSVGDYALAFRTNTDKRHWRIVRNSGRYYVHPRPNPYNSLVEIVQHFREAVEQETGLTMVPLVCNPTPKILDDAETNGTSNTLKAPPSPQRPGSTVVPTLSLSKLNPANLTSWSVDDVCYWLTQQGLGRFIEIFKNNAVDGECLLSLDNTLLKNDLGITALGHRSRILKRVQALKEQVHPHLS